MKALVTGASGFIGSSVAIALLSRGLEVRVLVRRRDRAPALRGLAVELVHGDVRTPASLAAAVADVDYVVHLAGTKHERKQEHYYAINRDGTRNLFDAVRAGSPRLRRFVFVSSQAAAGPATAGRPVSESDPCDPVMGYGKSKRQAELYLQERARQLPVTIVRPTFVYGPRSPETIWVMRALRWRLLPPASNEEQRFNLIYIDDCVDGILAALDSDVPSGEAYFITDSQAHAWDELVGTVADIRARSRWLLPVTWGSVVTAGRVMESGCGLLRIRCDIIDDKIRQLGQAAWLCSGDKARQHLGFVATTSLRDGLERTLATTRARVPVVGGESG